MTTYLEQAREVGARDLDADVVAAVVHLSLRTTHHIHTYIMDSDWVRGSGGGEGGCQQ
jgi:hypothetical protein